MNSRNVATKEIVSTLESEHGSASDISTRPEKSEHSGWRPKKQNKPEQLKQTNKTNNKSTGCEPEKREGKKSK